MIFFEALQIALKDIYFRIFSEEFNRLISAPSPTINLDLSDEKSEA